ncbi:hypothetical protein PUN28_015602 [Cardiocondyla obscurior]|uniref:Uncharacterized protein n=1 Tax=Cardiocondyla obscurior TaxID=286306 RepID=A0AAW2EYB8_9HYME
MRDLRCARRSLAPASRDLQHASSPRENPEVFLLFPTSSRPRAASSPPPPFSHPPLIFCSSSSFTPWSTEEGWSTDWRGSGQVLEILAFTFGADQVTLVPFSLFAPKITIICSDEFAPRSFSKISQFPSIFSCWRAKKKRKKKRADGRGFSLFLLPYVFQALRAQESRRNIATVAVNSLTRVVYFCCGKRKTEEKQGRVRIVTRFLERENDSDLLSLFQFVLAVFRSE